MSALTFHAVMDSHEFQFCEESYRAQYRPTKSRIDGVEFLHKNIHPVPAKLLNEKGRLSPIGWLLATRATISLIGHITKLKMQASEATQADMQ